MKWGMIKGPYADTMISDDQRLYWIEYSKLYFKDKGTGSEGKVVLPWDHTGGALAIDDRYVYTAMPGCPAILRIDKRSLAIEEMDIGGVAIDPRGGNTILRLQDGGFYCGAWGHIFWIPGWEQPAKRLVDSANRLWGMALAAGSLYWINNPGNQHMPYMSRLELDSGVVTNFPEEAAVGASTLIATPDGAWLFYASSTMLHAFATSANVAMIAFPPDFTGRRAASFGWQIETDGEALYYTATRGIEGVGRVFGVHKVPFSYLIGRLQKP